MKGQRRIPQPKPKGDRFEREVAAILNEVLVTDRFKRKGLSRSEGPLIGDIVYPPWWRHPIECKHVESWTFEQFLAGKGAFAAWYRKIAAECEAQNPELHPIVVLKRSRTAIWVYTDLVPPYPNRALLSRGLWSDHEGFFLVDFREWLVAMHGIYLAPRR